MLRQPRCRFPAIPVALLALVISVSSVLRRPEGLPALVARVSPAVVAVECRRPTGDLASGSGVVVDPSGLVVTSFHVVRDARSIRVTLYSGLSVAAAMVGFDEDADLAVLRLLGVSGLPHLRIGRAEGLLVGQRVIALGNAHGLGASGEPSLTVGIVGGKHRRVMGKEWYEMDAQVYPGNSGGPVCDMSGDVVGVSVALSSHMKPYFVPFDAERRAVLRDISGGLIGPPA